MSAFIFCPLEVLTDRRLKPTQRNVLLALYSFRGKNTNTVHPSRDALAERSGYRPTFISKVTTELEGLGWLTKEGRGGHSKSTRYALTVPEQNGTQSVNCKSTDNGTQRVNRSKGRNSRQTVNGTQTANGTQSVNGRGTQTVNTTGTQTVNTPRTQTVNTQRTDHLNKPLEQTIGTEVAQGAVATSRPAPTAAAWESYRDAYRGRYGVDPVRNARVNGQLAQLVQRLGQQMAPLVAAYYLTCNRQFYVAKGHQVGPMLADAEQLAAEVNGAQRTTSTQARNADRHQAQGDVFKRLLERAEE